MIDGFAKEYLHNDMWVSEHETRAEIVDRYRRTWKHADATIDALPIDALGFVPCGRAPT